MKFEPLKENSGKKEKFFVLFGHLLCFNKAEDKFWAVDNVSEGRTTRHRLFFTFSKLCTSDDIELLQLIIGPYKFSYVLTKIKQ